MCLMATSIRLSPNSSQRSIWMIVILISFIHSVKSFHLWTWSQNAKHQQEQQQYKSDHNYNDDDDDSLRLESRRNVHIIDNDELWNVHSGQLLKFGTSAQVFYDYTSRIPRYSIEKLDCTKFSNREVNSRRNYFTADERIPKEFRNNPKYYHDESHIDRGHMMPAADFVSSIDEYKMSFRYSNIFPQNSNLNRNVWARCEDLARHLVQFQAIKTLWVYTGNGVSIVKNQMGSYERLMPILGTNDGGMGWPDFVFKIFYAQSNDKNYVFAFVLPNEPVKFENDVLVSHRISIGELEKLSGLKFPNKLKDKSNLDLCAHFDCLLEGGQNNDWQSNYDQSPTDNRSKVNVCLHSVEL